MQHATELVKVQLPLPMLLAGAVIWIVVAFFALNGQNRLFQVFYLAIGARYMMNFFHDFTSTSVAGGQSLSSIVTLSIIAGGLFLARNHLMRYKVILPVYAFSFILFYSGYLNGYVGGAITSILRQMMFVATILVVVRLVDEESHNGSFSERLLTLFYVPLFYQALSSVFGIATFHELDGVASFIGGYIHESVFSSMMLAAMCISVLAPGLTWRRRTLYVLVFFASIVVANYRTTLVAALPILFAHFVMGSGQGVRADVAVVLRASAAIVVALLGIVFMAVMAERLSDIAVVVSGLDDLIKPPNEFGEVDRRLLSGRLWLWSDYVYTTISSSFSHITLGFGPESWSEKFGLYAHNTFVSYIYEVGFVGLAVHVMVTLSFFWQAATCRHPARWLLVSCHVSYIVLSLGTMPTLQVEGVFLYAFICGFTLYYKLTETQKTWFLLKSQRPSHSIATARR